MHTLTRRSLVAALTLLALGAASCAASASAAIGATAGDRGRTIVLEPDQELVVTLESNASTGFRWVLTSAPDPAVVELVGSTYRDADSQLLGAPGQERWTFRGVEPGSTELALTYQRSSGETSGTPYELTVEVR